MAKYIGVGVVVESFPSVVVWCGEVRWPCAGGAPCYIRRLAGHAEESRLSKYMPQALLSLITLTFQFIQYNVFQ